MAVVEEGHRDGRRPDGEHARSRSSSSGRLRAPTATRDDRADAGPPVIETVLRVRASRTPRRAAPAGPTTRRPRPRGRAAARRRDHVSFNGVEVTGWDQLRDLIRANADGEAVIGYERDGEHDDRHHQHDGRRPDRPRAPTRRSSQVGFLGVTPDQPRVVTGGPLYTLEQMGTMTVDDGHRPWSPCR